MRVTLFTDTLGDVNGVSRFIRNVAARARATGRDLTVVTSTRFEVPGEPNLINFKPLFAAAMPGYANLEWVIPPAIRMLRYLEERRPDALHISTPGPVGLVGYIAARLGRIPTLGVYHTDFPAYIDHLFGDEAMTWITARFMRFFYGPFVTIFSRSTDYVDSLERIGIARSRCESLRPGIDLRSFDPRFRDPTVWGRIGARPGSVKVLSCGRVSVEKNLPLLTKVWKQAYGELQARGIDAQLIVVGDGPYRAAMEAELEGAGAVFAGFRHGAELSAIYASSDLFVFPSTTDTLGQVVMESQASGLPVIVSDQGGPKEVVGEGCGFVLPADDPARWVRTIVDLCSDAGRRGAMGARAHAAMQGMSIDASFEHFWGVHERAVKPPDGSPQK